MITVGIAVLDGISMLEIAAPCDVFHHRPEGWDGEWYDVRVCGPRDARVGGWFRADSDDDYAALADVDLLIVPACRSIDSPVPVALLEAVRAAAANGARVASICTGAFVLAAAGVLDGRKATTHWMHSAELARRHPLVNVVPEVLYVDEGAVLTSAGKAAGIDLCLHLVRSDFGAAVANTVARRLVMPPHREGGQAQFVAPPATASTDYVLSDLLPWVVQRLGEPLTVVDLAEQARISTRQLTRRFLAATGLSPLQWLLSQRIYLAQELLETTDLSVEMVARRAALGSAANLRRHFNRALGVAPDTYRRTFRATTAPAAVTAAVS